MGLFRKREQDSAGVLGWATWAHSPGQARRELVMLSVEYGVKRVFLRSPEGLPVGGEAGYTVRKVQNLLLDGTLSFSVEHVDRLSHGLLPTAAFSSRGIEGPLIVNSSHLEVVLDRVEAGLIPLAAEVADLKVIARGLRPRFESVCASRPSVPALSYLQAPTLEHETRVDWLRFALLQEALSAASRSGASDVAVAAGAILVVRVGIESMTRRRAGASANGPRAEALDEPKAPELTPQEFRAGVFELTRFAENANLIDTHRLLLDELVKSEAGDH